jgi:7-cyano-7-deazaguanine synthase
MTQSIKSSPKQSKGFDFTYWSAQKRIYLLSGGLDSVSSLYLDLSNLSYTSGAIRKAAQGVAQKMDVFDHEMDLMRSKNPNRKKNFGVALYIDYGQKASKREELVAKYHAKKLGLQFIRIRTSLLSKYGKSSLTRTDIRIPQGQELDIESLETSLKSAKKVWVPNRNGLFLNLAAFYAEALGASEVVIGFNKEEAQTFPDNSAEFLKKANEFFSFSTANKVHVRSPTLLLEKPEIVSRVQGLFPLAQIWPCYEGGDFWCGECESCLRSKRAMEKNNLNWEQLRDENKIFIRNLSLHRS